MSGFSRETETKSRERFSVDRSVEEIEAKVRGGTTFQVGGYFEIHPSIMVAFSYLAPYRFEIEQGRSRTMSGDVNQGEQLPGQKHVSPAFYSIGGTWVPSDILMLSIEYQNRPFAGPLC